ncbi:SGNH/GDSL hydrolase family protein [Mesobacillus boroniphilus]|uniref:SGNH/GDSL hydrolase family protein n=1 Tax=Mesobacillus boroniphilus TaxID=308892 RepID=A0A944CKZ5_9BACI|nr:SGNH/GDSL hydrolase family protein [Mesobacillus boroniphilus]MBS8264567.1 SGNH/GDSL hydrolase family protein [Mesobacillus boroniphilus]
MKSNPKKIFSVVFLTAAVISFLAIQSDHSFSEDLTVYEKIKAGSSFNYLIIGDSIGRGAGAENKDLRWYSQLEVLLEDFSGARARRNMIVQSGATSFEGIYKLQKSPKFRDIELIFIVFGENDRKYMAPEQFTYFYENLIRNAKERYPGSEIITIIESPLKQEQFAETINRVSAHYGAKPLDMRIPFKQSGMLTEQLTTDTVHPNGKGYQLYASAILDLIKNNIRIDAEIASLPKPLTRDQTLYLSERKHVSDSNGFTIENGINISKRPGDYLEYEFDGSILGVKAIRSQDGGKLKVYIDGEYVRTISTWWPFTRERYLYIASGLDNGGHTVRFETAENAYPNTPTEKTVIQIQSIILANVKKK